MSKTKTSYSILLGVAVIAVIFVLAMFRIQPVYAQGSVDFRIVDVRAEHGQLLVEVEHFDDLGDFWFYELYTWQGREGNNHAIAVDFEGRPLLSNGRIAPQKENIAGVLRAYLPAGKEWQRETDIRMDDNSITSVIEEIHTKRKISGWTKGTERLTVRPLEYTDADAGGLATLVTKFEPLTERAYIKDNNGSLATVDYRGRGGPRNYPSKTKWGTVSTFYPSLDGETSYVDASGLTWGTIRGQATGTGGGAGKCAELGSRGYISAGCGYYPSGWPGHGPVTAS